MGSCSVTCHPTEVRIPPLPPAEAGTRFSDPGGMQGWVDLCHVKATGWTWGGRRRQSADHPTCVKWRWSLSDACLQVCCHQQWSRWESDVAVSVFQCPATPSQQSADRDSLQRRPHSVLTLWCVARQSSMEVTHTLRLPPRFWLHF